MAKFVPQGRMPTKKFDGDEIRPVGVKVKQSVWLRFRAYCLKAQRQPGEVLTEVLDRFLTGQGE